MPEAVKNAIDALKSNPLLLAVILLNVLFIVAALFYLRAEQRQMDAMITMIAACVEQRNVIPPPLPLPRPLQQPEP